MKAARAVERIVFIHRQLTVNCNDKCHEMNEDLINVLKMNEGLTFTRPSKAALHHSCESMYQS